MKISLITDEISADPETAFELGRSWGISDFELRGYFTDRIPMFSKHQTRRLMDMIARFEVQIVAIAPGLFKMPLPGKDAPEFPLGWMDAALYTTWEEANQQVHYHLNELLPKSLDYANDLGVKKIIIFGFDRGGAAPADPPDELYEILRLAAEKTAAAGIQLAIENESGFWADTGERTAKIVRAINNPALGVNWDPGNAFFAGDDPYPTGYASLQDLVRHVHFKDAMQASNGEMVYTEKGQIDWAGQIKALKLDQYQGYISVETHIRPKVSSAKAATDRLKGLISSAG